MKQTLPLILRMSLPGLLLTAVFLSCGPGNASLTPQAEEKAPIRATALDEAPPYVPTTFDRSSIETRLREKIKAGQPLVAHVLVPLCDNENQGIVKVNASLGNGQNTRTNLYWGAGYGIRTHFQRAADWKQVHISVPEEAHLLERVVFHKRFPNGARVYLIADAYDGAYMATCISDFLRSLAGQASGQIIAGADTLEGWAGADLVALNGHNGLMDGDVAIPGNPDGRHRDAVVIACASHGYFVDPLMQTGGYPLLTTTHLLAPEAYVMRAVIDAWAELKSGPDIRLAAGAAYHQYQKCGLNGATRLFKTGW